MIETLYTNGCSWTFGAELEQDPAFAEYITSHGWHMQDPTNELNWSLVDNDGMIMSSLDLQYDLFNWPGSLKTISGAKTLTNQGLGGGSNTRILRTTLDFIKQLKPSQYNKTLIVIGWTTSERDEILINKTWQRWNIVQPFSQTVDREVIKDEKYISALDRHQLDYTSLVFDDYANILKYFNSVYMLSNTLNNLGIKHYFFNALPAWWEGGEYKTDVNVQEEFGRELEWHENQKNIQNFRDSFMHYVQINDLPTGKYLHPLHIAHTAWANYIWQDMQARGVV